MGSMSKFRLACTIFIAISVCAFPVFFTIGVGLFAILWFKNYYEIIPLAFFNDVLYGVPLDRFYNFPYIMTVSAAVLVAIAILVRKQMFDTSPQKI